jgi:hypothetical protein
LYGLLLGRSAHIDVHHFGIHIHIDVHCYVLSLIVLWSLVLMGVVVPHRIMPSVALELGGVRVDEVVGMVARRSRLIGMMRMGLLIFLYKVIEVDPILLSRIRSVVA